MAQSTPKIPAEFVMPLNMNGLHGRMLRIPPTKSQKREILFVYGHHASLERYYPIAEAISDYGGVTMPDLPGFGGMDSFYDIGEKPDLDTMADYLASFVKLRYNTRHRFTLVGASYGFLVATRMLQRYPALAARVDMLVSIVGFVHQEDFLFTPARRRFYKTLATLLSTKPTAAFFHYVCIHPIVLRTVYSRLHNAKHKFADVTPEEKKILTDLEIELWRINEARTYMTTTLSMLNANNCQARVELPVWHIYVKGDNYFDNNVVEQHMRVVFTDFHPAEAKLKNHMPTVLSGKEETLSLFPRKIRQQLAKKV